VPANESVRSGRSPLPNHEQFGDDVAVGDDPHPVERADDAHLAMRVLGRHAVVVPIEPDQRQAVRLPINNASGFETVIWNLEHRLAILFEMVDVRAGLALQLTLQVFTAEPIVVSPLPRGASRRCEPRRRC
jgi:hypothetical protein